MYQNLYVFCKEQHIKVSMTPIKLSFLRKHLSCPYFIAVIENELKAPYHVEVNHQIM